MSDVPGPHDRYFRETFSRRATLQGFVREYLPGQVVRCLDLRTLRITADSFVDPELRLHSSDLVCRVRMAEGSGRAYVYLLFEHKSRPDPLVPLQLLRYMMKLWEQALREGEKPPLPPVIPLVLYHGRERWSVATEFGALLRCPEALAPYLPAFRYLLTDLAGCRCRWWSGSAESRGYPCCGASSGSGHGRLPGKLPGRANLLGGPAWRYEMFPLVTQELGPMEELDVLRILQRGTVPDPRRIPQILGRQGGNVGRRPGYGFSRERVGPGLPTTRWLGGAATHRTTHPGSGLHPDLLSDRHCLVASRQSCHTTPQRRRLAAGPGWGP